MGTYTTQEFLDTFGGLPERDDHMWAGPDPAAMSEQKHDEPVILSEDHPGFIDCSRCHIGVRADLFTCPACGAET